MASALSHRELSRLIGSIYDCALNPSRWEQALADIRDTLNFQSAVLGLVDVRYNRTLIHKSVGIEPHWLGQFPKYQPDMSRLLASSLTSGHSMDEPHLMSRHLPRDLVNGSAYVQEYLRPQGLFDRVALFLMHTRKRCVAIGMNRHERQGPITEREIELGALLLPHLRRAVMISNVLDARTIELAGALDALRCGVVLTDKRGTILYANRSAEFMLVDRSGPIRAAGGVLKANTPSAAKELRTAIELSAQQEPGIGKTGVAILLTKSDMQPVFAHVLPLVGSDLRTQLQPAAVAAVFIGAIDEQGSAQTLAAAFGLTPGETRVLTSLLAGRTLADTAAALGVAASTAKAHLDAIFSKTGITRQADLVRLGTGLVPPVKTST